MGKKVCGLEPLLGLLAVLCTGCIQPYKLLPFPRRKTYKMHMTTILKTYFFAAVLSSTTPSRPEGGRSFCLQCQLIYAAVVCHV